MVFNEMKLSGVILLVVALFLAGCSGNTPVPQNQASVTPAVAVAQATPVPAAVTVGASGTMLSVPPTAVASPAAANTGVAAGTAAAIPTTAAAPPIASAMPTLTNSGMAVSQTVAIRGQVANVAASARVIQLAQPAEGFTAIALENDSQLLGADGNQIGLQDIKPGVEIEATGRPGSAGALLARKVQLAARPLAVQRSGIQATPGADPADLLAAQRVMQDYFQALVSNQPDRALALMTPGAQVQTNVANLATAIQGVKAINVTGVTLVGASPSRMVFRVDFNVTPNPDKPGAWNPGANARFVELLRVGQDWRIAEIASAPIGIWAPGPEMKWQRITVPDQGISFEIPDGWVQFGSERAWVSPGADRSSSRLPTRVGINWNDITPGWQPSAMLPNHAQVLSGETVNLTWSRAVSQTLQITGAAAQGGGVVGYETHVIAPLGSQRAYDFYATAGSAEELLKLQPVLQHMLESSQVHGQ